jgi:Domain of unknown function (DUF4190)
VQTSTPIPPAPSLEELAQQAHRRSVRFAIGALASFAALIIVAFLAPGVLESSESAPWAVLENLLLLSLVVCTIVSVKARHRRKLLVRLGPALPRVGEHAMTMRDPIGVELPPAPGDPDRPEYQAGLERLIPRNNGLAVASLVLGILSPFFWYFPPLSILAVILGFASKGQINRSGGAQTGRGIATAGIVLGFLTLIGCLIFVLSLWGCLNSSDCHLGL